ncbi:MAG TPA: 1,4-dihydroxy-2-naphthoate octaprenyltransferase [Rhizobiales bacterium]|nr:1,4-dihydroxy-2-naphthoate octaprenyltransferase [Hyphomicrobiales bacterium]
MAPQQAPNNAPSGMIGIWLAAIRPKTLLLSLGPVILSALIGGREGSLTYWYLFPIIALAAMAIQIATNLWNDAADSDSGLDDQTTRLGPARMTSMGLLSAQQVRLAALLFLAIASLCGLFLVFAGGWPILAIGLAGIICALAYSSGPYPIAASPFGEAFVLAFFGLFAVAGSHYLLTGFWSQMALVAGLYAGLPAAVVLIMNNHRDRIGDEQGGRRTLAILLGPQPTKIFYTALMSVSSLGPLHLGHGSVTAIAASALLFVIALTLPIRSLWHAADAQSLNKILSQTAAFQLMWIVIFGIWLFST